MRRHQQMTHGARRRTTLRRYRRAAVVAALALTLFTVAAFLNQSPIGRGYELQGVFSSANQLRLGSDVRVAGLRVGEVEGIEAGPDNTSIVTMRIDEAGRPIHADATLAVKPRLILEGNAYVEVRPGSPSASELGSGDTIPLERTAVTPQLDQVLNTFNLSTRDALHRSIFALGEGLGAGARDQGIGRETGYEGLRRAARELDGALASVTQVARAARGTEPGDLSRAVGSSGEVTAQLSEDPEALADLITNFNRLTRAMAADDRALAASVRGFDEVFRVARPSLRELDAALPTLTRFGDSLRPALRTAPPALRETNELLGQIEALMRPGELPSLLNELEPVTARLPELVRRLRTLFPLVSPVTDCLSTHIIPTLNMKIDPADGYPHSTGDPIWLELMHSYTGWSSVASSVDANGGTVRAGLAGGEQALEGVIPGLGPVAAFMPEAPQGVRPTWLGYGEEPVYRPDQSCAEQQLPDLNKRSGPPPDWDLSPVSDPGEGER